jgi:hypothetical protein
MPWRQVAKATLDKEEPSMKTSQRLGIVLLVGATLAAPVGTAAGTRATRTPVERVTSPLDGRWTATITRAQLRRAGAVVTLAGKLYGSYTAVYENGRFEFDNHRNGAVTRGTFAIRGRVARIVFFSGVAVRRGDVSECTWSIYRERLTFKPISGRRSMLCNAGVWSRAA